MDEKLGKRGKRATYGADPDDQANSARTNGQEGPHADDRSNHGSDGPLPLLPELPPPEPFPVNSLPPVMRDATLAIAVKVQVGNRFGGAVDPRDGSFGGAGPR